MTASELDAWEVGEQTLEPFSGSSHPPAFPSERSRTNKRKDHLWMELAEHLLIIARTQSTKPAADNGTDDSGIHKLTPCAVWILFILFHICTLLHTFSDRV